MRPRLAAGLPFRGKSILAAPHSPRTKRPGAPRVREEALARVLDGSSKRAGPACIRGAAFTSHHKRPRGAGSASMTPSRAEHISQTAYLRAQEKAGAPSRTPAAVISYSPAPKSRSALRARSSARSRSRSVRLSTCSTSERTCCTWRSSASASPASWRPEAHR